MIASTETPRARGTWIFPRRRLLKALDQAVSRGAVLVQGPPGSGKTTLVQDFLGRRRRKTIWHSLSPADSDLSVFFKSLAEEVCRFFPEVGAKLPALTVDLHFGPGAFAHRFFRDLFRSMPRGSSLVFDNFERISGDFPVAALLEEYIGHAGHPSPLLLLSRVPLPDTISRFFVNRTLSRIAWDDLALTRLEIAAMARARLGPGFSEDRADRLVEQTHGWMAGVVLILEHFRQIGDFGSEEPAHGKDLFAYFASEILGSFPRDVQEALLAVSFFPRLGPDVLAAFQNVDPSPGVDLPAILSRLNRDHFFVMQDSAGKHVFHPLFQEFLQDRLLATRPNEATGRLMTLTGEILEAAGDWQTAFDLFARAKETTRMSDLVERRAASMIELQRHRILCGWIERLPPAHFEGRPWLRYWDAVARFPFDPARARELFQQAHAAFETTGELFGAWLAWCGIVQSILVHWDEFDTLDRWLAWAETRLDVRPVFPAPEFEAMVLRDYVGGLVYRSPDHPALERRVEQLLNLARKIRDSSLRISILWLLALYFGWIGEIGRGRMLLVSLETESTPELPAFVEIQRKLALAIYGWLGISPSPSDSLVRVQEGIELAESSEVHAWDAFLFAQAVYACLSDDRRTEAEQFLVKLRGAMNPNRRLHLSHFHYLSGWARTLDEDHQTALFHTETALAAAESSGAMFPEISARLAHAQVLLALGRRREARRQIALAARAAKGMGSALLLFLCGLVELDAFMEERPLPGERVCKTLKKTLGLGREGQFFNFQWWNPKQMVRICRTALEMGIEVPYVQRMISLRSLRPDDLCDHIETWPWTYRIYGLGPFRILKDGKPASSSSRMPRKVVDMLYLVAMEGRRAIHQDDLIEALWPDAEGDKAKGVFDVTLHRLRERFGDQLVHLSGGMVALNQNLCWTDVRALEQLFRTMEGKWSGSSVDPRDIDRCFGRLKSLYRETPADRGSDPPRVVAMRERLHRSWRAAVADLGRLHEESGRWEKAQACYRYGLDVDPTHEPFLQRSMRVLSRSGRTEEIGPLFEQFLRNLSRAGKEGPGAETRKLHKSLTGS